MQKQHRQDVESELITITLDTPGYETPDRVECIDNHTLWERVSRYDLTADLGCGSISEQVIDAYDVHLSRAWQASPTPRQSPITIPKIPSPPREDYQLTPFPKLEGAEEDVIEWPAGLPTEFDD